MVRCSFGWMIRSSFTLVKQSAIAWSLSFVFVLEVLRHVVKYAWYVLCFGRLQGVGRRVGAKIRVTVWTWHSSLCLKCMAPVSSPPIEITGAALLQCAKMSILQQSSPPARKSLRDWRHQSQIGGVSLLALHLRGTGSQLLGTQDAEPMGDRDSEPSSEKVEQPSNPLEQG